MLGSLGFLNDLGWLFNSRFFSRDFLELRSKKKLKIQEFWWKLLSRLPLYPFYGQPLDQVWISSLAIKRIKVVGQTHQVGALFESQNEHVLMAASICLAFFSIQTILHEHCVVIL